MPDSPIRLNKFLAQATALSRRGADAVITDGRVLVNDMLPTAGQSVSDGDTVKLDGKQIHAPDSSNIATILLNKPVGYVCSRNGQGSKTIYELLPPALQNLNSVGRLDKASSGLLLLTNDGQLANSLTHPRFGKIKVYEITLNKPLQPLHQQMINDYGITLEDGISKLQIEKQGSAQELLITMQEGRNRQIRRTFNSLGYDVTKLHRITFGNYQLEALAPGAWRETREL